MSKHMERILRDAVAQGLLADAEHDQPGDRRHWSVLVLTAVASWFSAVPLIGVVLLMLSPALKQWVGPLVAGSMMLAGSIAVLRSAKANLFVEQLGVPGLAAGVCLLGLGLFELTDSDAAAAILLLPVVCLAAVLVPRSWVRTLLGVAIACLVAYGPGGVSAHYLPADWWRWHVAAAAWLALQAVQRRIELDRASAPMLSLLEAASGGMAAATLVALAVSSGSTFLLTAFTGGHGNAGSLHGYVLPQLVSVALAALGPAWLASRWTALRAWWFAALAGLLAVAAWFAPSLGIVLVLLSTCVASRRHALAVLAGVAALWMVGGLYYQLDWPLAGKAALLLGLGAAMGALARYAIPGETGLPLPSAQPQATPLPLAPPHRLGLLLCGVLVLAAANVAIWQKESVIRNGTAVFVELAPADPRSLMQGDFMALRFAIPAAGYLRPSRLSGAPKVVAQADARGVASLLRLDDGRPLAAGEFVIQLVTKNSEWTIATDAWYFSEGEGARWARAKYGEFRVAPDGRALLVGLRGPGLQKL